MNLEQMMRKLRQLERESYDHWSASRAMCEQLDHEEYLRKRAEDAYTQWLRHNNADSIKYKYPNNPSDYEKFMWIEGYMASNRRGYR